MKLEFDIHMNFPNNFLHETKCKMQIYLALNVTQIDNFQSVIFLIYTLEDAL